MATISSTIKLNDQMSAKLTIIQHGLEDVDSAAAKVSESVTKTGDKMKGISNSSKEAGSSLDTLASKVRNVVAALGGLAAINKVINISDDLTSTNARLQMVADNFGIAEDQVDAFTNAVYKSANASRGSFDAMASLVSRLGNNAKDAFNSADELLEFAEGVQKLMTIAGASTTEASNAMLQLSQALASGTLRGDELNSIFEQAPNLIQKIADYMGVNIGEIRSLASEGQISADIVKNAILDAMDGEDGINKQFEKMPTTFGQAMTQIQNYALQSFTPVLTQINNMLNSETGQSALIDVMNNIATLANIASSAINVLGSAFKFVYDNASMLIPVLGLVTALVVAYNVAQGVHAAIAAVSAAAETTHSVAVALVSVALGAATAQQHAFNAALLASPVTWIVVAIMAVVTAVILFAQHIANAGDTAANAFSVICGWISVAIGWFQNLWTNIQILCSNIPIAFTNACAGAQQAFYNLLATALSVIGSIASALNALPFVSIDTSGLEAAADSYKSKASAAAAKKQSYNAFQSYDYKTAYNKGVEWGNSKSNAASDLANKLTSLGTTTGATGSGSNLASSAAKTAGNTGSTAGSAKSIDSKMDDTTEQLEYLCDIAERDAINRFTTASISVDMVNNNSISSALDLDTIVDGLAGRLQTSMAMVAEGA